MTTHYEVIIRHDDSEQRWSHLVKRNGRDMQRSFAYEHPSAEVAQEAATLAILSFVRKYKDHASFRTSIFTEPLASEVRKMREAERDFHAALRRKYPHSTPILVAERKAHKARKAVVPSLTLDDLV